MLQGRNTVRDSGATYTVLYVDDGPDDPELGRLFPERDGELRIETRGSAAQGLAAFRERPYDAVVSDSQMPGMDGISFLKAVRPEFGDLPFVPYTGRGEEIAIAAINEGVDRYIQKGGNTVVQYAELAHGIRQAVLRREAEQSLRRGEEQFRRLMDNAKDIVYRMALPSGEHLFVSRAVLEITGNAPMSSTRTPGCSGGSSIRTGRHTPRPCGTPSSGGPRRHATSTRWSTARGGTRWINQRNVLVCGDDGVPVAIEAIATDVTRQKEAGQELRMSEQRFRRLFEQIPVGIAVVVAPLRYRMVGHPAEELEGQPFAAVTEEGVSRSASPSTGAWSRGRCRSSGSRSGAGVGRPDRPRPGHGLPDPRRAGDRGAPALGHRGASRRRRRGPYLIVGPGQRRDIRIP